MYLLWYICQEVYLFNRPAASLAHPTLIPTAEPSFQPRAATTGRSLTELALLTEVEFREQFSRSATKRAMQRGLMRNVAAALCMREDNDATAALDLVLSDPDPLVREAAAGSLAR